MNSSTINNFSEFQENMKKIREKPDTKRAGLKWEKEEEEQLIDMIKKNTSTSEIAKKLFRTEGGIITRITTTIIQKIEEGSTVEEIAEEFNMTTAQVKTYTEKENDQEKEDKFSNYNKSNHHNQQNNSSNVKYIQTPSIKDLYNEIKEIKNMLVSIQNAINKTNKLK